MKMPIKVQEKVWDRINDSSISVDNLKITGLKKHISMTQERTIKDIKEKCTINLIVT